MDLNVLIVGGGIHGVGLLHDLASRGIRDVHLVERDQIACGTSSRSTKLLHGGLRYLEHFSQWPLVREALHERSLLLKLLKNITRPLPFVLPSFRSDKRPPWLVGCGLFFYDLLAGDSGLPQSQRIRKEDILAHAPYLKKTKVENEMVGGFIYYDAQMLDDVVTRVAAFSAVKLGATLEEHTQATQVVPIPGGFRVTLVNSHSTRTLTTRYVINAGGAFCNANLLQWGFKPNITCLLNLGTHLVFNPEVLPQANVETASATLIQEQDGRVVFFIPWFGKWLFGTTESILENDPAKLTCPESDKRYLMKTAEEVLDLTHAEKHVDEVFCGVRCMPLKQKYRAPNIKSIWQEDPYSSPYYIKSSAENISGLSRETVVNEVVPGLLSIYGGKFTTYRAIGKNLGGRLSRELKTGSLSNTHLPHSWFLQELLEEHPEIFTTSKALRARNG